MMTRKSIFTLAAGILMVLGSFLSTPTLAKFKALCDGLPAHCNLLFIQVAGSGELLPIQNNPTQYKLVLNKVDPYTSYFTDRPNRVTGIVSTNQFVDIWQSQAGIKKTPPNVAIETSNVSNGQKINCIFVLSDPVYNAKKHQITYTASLLNRHRAPLTHLSIGYTVLFIDDFNWGGNIFGG